MKVTVTHYDASKKSGMGGLVATPTHTETIIVTPPKSDPNSLLGSKTSKQFSVPPPLHHVNPSKQ